MYVYGNLCINYQQTNKVIVKSSFEFINKFPFVSIGPR